MAVMAEKKRKRKSPAAEPPLPPCPPPDSEKTEPGFRCPDCGCGHLLLTSASRWGRDQVRARRICRYCGRIIVILQKSSAW